MPDYVYLLEFSYDSLLSENFVVGIYATANAAETAGEDRLASARHHFRPLFDDPKSPPCRAKYWVKGLPVLA